MIVKVLLAIFLALALVSQGGLVCIQVDNDHVLTALVNTSRVVHLANNDFDDDQRGAKAYAVVPLDSPFSLGVPAKPAHRIAQATLFSPLRPLPLFKLKAAFLI